MTHTMVLAAAIGLALAVGAIAPELARAQAADQVAAVSAGPSITIALPEGASRGQTSSAIRILLLLTVLSVAPGILISMTSFTRIVVVLSFVRQAVGTQNAPPTQVVLALALMLTGVVMGPVLSRIHDQALAPYLDEEIDESQAYERASGEIRAFLLRQTREADLRLFYEVSAATAPADENEVSLHLLVPAFLISELRTGFEMGFLLFLPFVLVDLITGSILTSMGMMMMPPTMISTPIKLLLFVLVDGWALLTRSLIASFGGGP